MRLKGLMKHILCSLHNLLLYYIRSRQAEGDYERLINILVSDRLKECLSAPARNYVLTITKATSTKSNQITQLDAAPKDNKGEKGVWHNKGKVQTEDVQKIHIVQATRRRSPRTGRLVLVCVSRVNLPIIC